MSSNRFQRNRGFRSNNQYSFVNREVPAQKRKRENDDFVPQTGQFPRNNTEYYQEEYDDQSDINNYDQPSTSSNIPQASWKWNKSEDLQSNNKRAFGNNYNQNNFSDNLHNDEQQSRFAVPKRKDYYNDNNTDKLHNNEQQSRFAAPKAKDYYKSAAPSRDYNPKYSANNRLKLLRDNLSKSVSDAPSNKYVPVMVQDQAKPRPNYPAKPSTMQARISKYKNVTIERTFATDTKLNTYASHTAVTPTASTNFNTAFENDHSSNTSTKQEDDIEYMEWSSIDVQEVLVNLEDIRRNNKDDKAFIPKTPLQHTFANLSTEMQLNKNLCKTLYIVIDTNIFISDLILVKQLLKLKINGVVNPILFIPWMVIQELDHLKDGKSGDKLRRPASWAVKFINKELSAKNPHLQGQSVRDAAKVNLMSKSPDDGILFCLLQIVENGNRPYLLSNDVNLRNKAILNDIEAYGQSEILKKLDPYDNNKLRSSTQKEEPEDVKQIKLHLSNLLTYILLKEVHDCYAAPPIEISNSPPPWSLLECLHLFKNYWGAIFAYKLQKQCINTIENFVQLIKEESYGVTNGFKDNLIELGLGLCVYIKNGLTKYSESVNQCIMRIEQDQQVYPY